MRTIAFISDMHEGTMYSLMPENYEVPEGARGYRIKEGNILIPNDGQKLIREYWERFGEEMDREAVDTIIWLSDLIHGQNPIERGTQLLTTDFNEQINMALEDVKPRAKGRKNHFVSGSGYHRGVRGGSPDEVICKIIAEMEDTEAYWHGPLILGPFEPSEKRWFISHGESQAFIYRSQVIDRENLHMNAAIGLEKIPKIHGVVHGHWHCSEYHMINRQHHIQVGCWCAFVPWRGSMKLYPKFQPDIGGTIVKITDDDEVIVKEYVYTPNPKISDYVRPL
jgi:hypothetical protein